MCEFGAGKRREVAYGHSRKREGLRLGHRRRRRHGILEIRRYYALETLYEWSEKESLGAAMPKPHCYHRCQKQSKSKSDGFLNEGLTWIVAPAATMVISPHMIFRIGWVALLALFMPLIWVVLKNSVKAFLVGAHQLMFPVPLSYCKCSPMTYGGVGIIDAFCSDIRRSMGHVSIISMIHLTKENLPIVPQTIPVLEKSRNVKNFFLLEVGFRWLVYNSQISSVSIYFHFINNFPKWTAFIPLFRLSLKEDSLKVFNLPRIWNAFHKNLC